MEVHFGLVVGIDYTEREPVVAIGIEEGIDLDKLEVVIEMPGSGCSSFVLRCLAQQEDHLKLQPQDTPSSLRDLVCSAC